MADLWAERPGVLNLDRVSRFKDENRPHDPEDPLTDAVLKKYEQPFAVLHTAVKDARDAELSAKQIADYVQLCETMRRLLDVAEKAQQKRGKRGRRSQA